MLCSSRCWGVRGLRLFWVSIIAQPFGNLLQYALVDRLEHSSSGGKEPELYGHMVLGGLPRTRFHFPQHRNVCSVGSAHVIRKMFPPFHKCLKRSTTPCIHCGSITVKPLFYSHNHKRRTNILDPLPSIHNLYISAIPGSKFVRSTPLLLSEVPSIHPYQRVYEHVYISRPRSSTRGKPCTRQFEALTDATFRSDTSLSHERQSSWIDPQGLWWVHGACC